MAKHFREEPAQQTAYMPRTRVRQEQVHTGEQVQRPVSYGEVASYRTSYVEPALDKDFYFDERPARGGIRAFGRFLLLMLAWACRIAALGGTALVLLNSFYVSAWHPKMAWLMDQVWTYIPWGRIHVLSVDTPFGGTFYGDIALMVLALFLIDWLLCRLRAALR